MVVSPYGKTRTISCYRINKNRIVRPFRCEQFLISSRGAIMNNLAATLFAFFFLVLPVTGGALFFSQPAYATSYYVDNLQGNDSNVGDKRNPWKTIAKVNNTSFNPGDKIYLAKDRTWNETLVISSSGTAGNPIQFSSYGTGALPVIDGSDSLTGTWRLEDVNVYSIDNPGTPGVLFYDNTPLHAVMSVTLDPSTDPIPSPGAILIQNENGHYNNLWVVGVDEPSKTMTAITNSSAWDTQRPITVRQINPDTGKEETWPKIPPPIDLSPKMISLQEDGQWFWDNGRIYLYSSQLPSTVTLRVGSRSFGINTNHQNYLDIRNIAIVGANSAGVHMTGTNYSKIRRLKITGTGALIYRSAIILKDSSYNNLSHNLLENNLGVGVAVYGSAGVSDHNTISNNTINDSGSSGIVVGGETPAQVEYNTVKDNTISRSNQLAYDSGGIYVYFSGDGNVIKRNTIQNGGTDELKSAGIMLDIDAGPARIERNIIRNNSHGGIVLTESNHIIRQNTLQYNSRPQFKTAEIVFFPVNDDVADIEVRHNDFTAAPGRSFFRVSTGSTIGHNIDKNDYVGGGNTPFYWAGREMTFEEWQQNTLNDLNSTYQQ